LKKEWKVTVGEGSATPALVGDKLYVFARQEGNEVTRCLEAATGKELWQDKYETGDAERAAARGPHGPRCSPTVADGKVVTLGVRSVLSCLDVATGKKLWRKDGGAWPMFYVASSPIVVDGLCIAQLGKESDGGVVAYDLTSGDEKWKWMGDGPAYASPVLLTVDGTKAIVAETAKNIVAISAADGKLLWETAFAPGGGRMRSYNACTPVVDGQTIVYSGAGRGTKAVKIGKQADKLEAKPLWNNSETAVQFNTPVFKDGLVFGLTDRGSLFCINAEDGKTAWSTDVGGRGYGSIVDAGSVLLALTPETQLIVLAPGNKEFKQLAKYKVGDSDTYAYPVVAGNRLYVKDRDSLTLWTIGAK
jgi:outer membrane protein assembly factor BamB